MTLDPKRLYIMDDVGTRAQHYMELQDVWGHGLQILTSPGHHSETERKRAEYLVIALELLQQQLETEYIPTTYAKVINDLPKDATEIVDDKHKEDGKRILGEIT